ncbi:DUF732 domain-containing protein [Mycobacterium kubicae]|nr:DUF732 domain-containing protein [Mycobacterium kubicae]
MFRQRRGLPSVFVQAEAVMVTRLAIAVALLSYMTIAAPPVHANATDDAFLGALTRKDIHFESPQTALIAAHEVCTELDAGKSKSDIASTIMQNTNLDGYHAGYFVGVSISAYCPNHTSD